MAIRPRCPAHSGGAAAQRSSTPRGPAAAGPPRAFLRSRRENSRGKVACTREPCQSCQLACTVVAPVHACRPLRTSGLERSGVGPAGTPDHSSPEVHSGRRSCTARRGRSIMLGHGPCSPFSYHMYVYGIDSLYRCTCAPRAGRGRTTASDSAPNGSCCGQFIERDGACGHSRWVVVFQG